MVRKLQLDGVQFENVRKTVDQKFADFHDALEDAYYNFWKKGLSKPVAGFDKQSTPAQSKALFDQIHGAIWWMHEIALCDENVRQGNPYPDDKINPTDEATGKNLKTLCQERFAALPKQTRDKLTAALA